MLRSAIGYPALNALLDEHAARLRFAYLERETRVLLTDSSSNEYRPKLETWEHGRAFGPLLEVRWRRDELHCEVHLLTEAVVALPLWPEASIAARLDEEARERRVLLAGVNVATLPPSHTLYDAQGGAWFSPEITRPLRYPLANPLARRAALRCMDYTVDGYTVLTRLCEVIPDER